MAWYLHTPQQFTQSVRVPLAQVSVLVHVLELLRLVPLNLWLEKHVDYLSVQARMPAVVAWSC